MNIFLLQCDLQNFDNKATSDDLNVAQLQLQF